MTFVERQEPKKDTRAHPKGGVRFNYAEVAPQSPDWPFAIMSLRLLNGELYSQQCLSAELV